MQAIETLVVRALRAAFRAWPFMCLHEADALFQNSLELLRPGDVALDIGADFGIWSLLTATRIAGGRIHAFEPVPAMAQRLRVHVQLNDARAIEIHQVALGDDNGSLPFFAVREANTGASGFARSNKLLSSNDAPALFFEIDDHLCPRDGTTSGDVKQILVDDGYRIYRWQRGALIWLLPETKGADL